MKKASTKNKKDFNLTFGSDPELCIRNRQTGEIVSAIDVLKHGKEEKIDLGGGFMVYYDNVLLETNIPYALNAKQFIVNTKETLRRIAKHLGANYDIVAQASHTFSAEQLNHDDARVFGCNPEFCAYTLDTVTPPDAQTGLRSCGAHIHIGRDDFKSFGENKEGVFLLDDYNKVDVIKAFDMVVGLPVAIMDNDPTSAARKKLYGKAGRHRPTPYGVEYRTPGNFWLSSPEMVELIFDLSIEAARLVERGDFEALAKALPSDQVINALDTNNKEKAASLLTKVNLSDDLRARIKDMAKKPRASLYEAWELA
jgi:hypothetical protein